MSSPEELSSKGRSCIDSAMRLHQYFAQSPAATAAGQVPQDAEETLNNLSSLREDGEELRGVAERIRQEQQDRQTTLLKELTSLGEKSHNPDATLAKLNRRRHQEESRLLKLQRNLTSSENKLRAAREVVLRAKSESSARGETAAAATAVSTSGALAGAVIGFGIGELVRLVMGYTRSPSSTGDSVLKAEHDVSVKQEEVKQLKQKVALAAKSLGSVERKILAHFETLSSSDNTKSSLLSKISSAKSMISFQSEVAEFWELFVRTASLATEHAQSLERLVGWAQEVRKVKVLRSSGYSTEEMTFAEAWEEVTFQHGLILQE